MKRLLIVSALCFSVYAVGEHSKQFSHQDNDSRQWAGIDHFAKAEVILPIKLLAFDNVCVIPEIRKPAIVTRSIPEEVSMLLAPVKDVAPHCNGPT